MTRDILNEAPTEDERARGNAASDSASLAASQQLYRSAILHTSLGDVTLKLFPQEVPKTVENFTSHAKSGYYNNILFHRVIKGFMLQTGDPRCVSAVYSAESVITYLLTSTNVGLVSHFFISLPVVYSKALFSVSSHLLLKLLLYTIITIHPLILSEGTAQEGRAYGAGSSKTSSTAR